MAGNSAVVGTLRAVLSADTAEFASAMKKAGDAADQTAKDMTKASASFEAAGGRMASVTRLVKDFSGSLERRSAEEFALAIEKIGGAAKLSENELKRASGVFSDYLSKAKALGQEVPPHIAKLNAELGKLVPATAGVGQALGNTWTTIKGFAGALGIGLGVGALTGLVKSALDTADQIGNMSEKLGVSTTKVQQWSHALRQSGADINTLDGVLEFMNKTLGAGELSTIQLLESLGLSLGKLRAAKSEEAFEDIVEAIAKIPDPLKQVDAVVKLLGRTGQDILPALRNNFLQVSAGATVMSEETIKRLKDAKQSWENFSNSVIIHTGEAIAAIGKLVESVAKARAKDALGDLSVWGIVPSAPTPTDVNLPNEQKLIERTQSLTDALKAANDALRNLSQAKKDDIAAGVALSMSTADIVKETGVAATVIELYKDRMQAAKSAATELANEAKRQAEAMKNLRSGITDLSDAQVALITSLLKAGKAEADIAKAYGFTTQQVSELSEQLKEAQKVEEDVEKQRQKQIAALKELESGLSDLTQEQIDQIATLLKAGKAQDDIATAYGFTKTQVKAVAKEQELHAKVLTMLTGIEEKYWKDQLKFADQSGKQTLANLKKIIDAEMDLAGFRASRDMTPYQREVAAIERWAEDTKRAFIGTTEEVEAFTAAIDGMAEARIKALGPEWSNELARVTGAFRQLGSAIGGTAGQIIQDVADIAEGIQRIGSGDVLGGILQIAATAAKHLKTLGRNIARDMQDAFATSELGFANLAALNDELKRLGAVDLVNRGDRAQRKDDEAATRKWMEDVKKFLSEADQKAQALASRLAAAFDELSGSVVDFGGKAPAALQPFIQELLKSTKLTEDQRMLLQGLAGAPEWQQLQSIAEKYGISLGSLGQQFQESRIGDIAMQYARDFMTLRDAGGDVNGILAGMQDEVQALVLESLKFGVALPEALRDVVQGLINMGQLTDENGDALTDLSRINFKGTLEDAFLDIKSILEEIRDLLAGGLTDAAAEGAKGIEDAFKGRDYTVPVRFEWGDLRPPDGFGVPVNGFDSAQTGGVVSKTGLVNVHAGEVIQPLDEMSAEDRYTIYLDNYLDGRKVTETVLIHTREVARRIGVRPI